MKTISTIILAIVLTCNLVAAQDTLYIYKSGAVVTKRAVNDIDSVIFYKTIDQNTAIYQGKMVGYLKCFDNEHEKILFGIFIITNNCDSLLSFNIPSTIYNLDSSKVDYGFSMFNGDSISFKYRNAKTEEIKQFDCPPEFMQNPGFLYPIDEFSQVIITEINKIQ